MKKQTGEVRKNMQIILDTLSEERSNRKELKE